MFAPFPTAPPEAPDAAAPADLAIETPAETSVEPDAWAEVVARWAEPAAHQAYLARFRDLDGLAAAGRRYREVLGARPDDAVALAMKAEILKRATVVGLAMLPRTPPPEQEGRRWRRIALLLLAAWLASSLAWLFWKLLGGTPL